MYYLIEGEMPWVTKEKYVKCEFSNTDPKSIAYQLQKITVRCLKKKPEDRPELKEILEELDTFQYFLFKLYVQHGSEQSDKKAIAILENGDF